MKKILFISTEAVPFAKTGGLGDVIGSLPAELLKAKLDARVMLPLYQSVKETYKKSLIKVADFKVNVAWRIQECKLYSLELDEVTYYFIENDLYFDRPNLYGYFDDGERFSFFPKAALEAIKHMDFLPNILHCSEWQTALVPVYLKTVLKEDRFYKKIKTVFTIHNIEYQGQYDPWIGGDLLGIDQSEYGILEYNGMLNFMKGAIVCSDKLTTVSPSYAAELKEPYFGSGLDHIIREYDYKLSGIINGIDKVVYDPLKDFNLAVNFSSRSPKKKAENKTALQEELGLEISKETPLIGIIGRLVAHKGVDIIEFVLDEILAKGVQIVILGSGDEWYENIFKQKEKQYLGKLSVNLGFNSELANRIYGSSDLFLMPSRSEPCGLAQMIALRYGTIPIVRETGGLKDSIVPFNVEEGTGNGITFVTYNAHDMLDAIQRGVDFYHDKDAWALLMKNAFASDFSWKNSAKEYVKLYRSI